MNEEPTILGALLVSLSMLIVAVFYTILVYLAFYLRAKYVQRWGRDQYDDAESYWMYATFWPLSILVSIISLIFKRPMNWLERKTTMFKKWFERKVTGE